MNQLRQQPKSGIANFTDYSIHSYPQLFKHQYPESFFSFPKPLLLVMLLLAICKLLMPFAMEDLYKSIAISPQQFLKMFLYSIMLIIVSYALERESQKMMSQHKINVRKILCQRTVKAHLIEDVIKSQNSGESLGIWSKTSSNINIYVNNYYDSSISLVFQGMKTVYIVWILVTKLGLISLVGLLLCVGTVLITLKLTKEIRAATFANIQVRDKKFSILTQYFQRIIDYQMSWYDCYIAEKIEKLEIQFHKNLRKGKMYDAVCVGLWQFVTTGISSIVLFCYYYYYGIDDQSLEPVTIVYFFQMLNFPLNCVPWNIDGLKQSYRALSQLSQLERCPSVDEKFRKRLYTQFKEQQDKYEEYFEIKVSQNPVRINKSKIYGISSDRPQVIRKMALQLCKNKQVKVGYAEENSWFLPNIVQTLLFNPQIDSQSVSSSPFRLSEATKILYYLEGRQIPYKNSVSTFSGGQKMRVSLCRALLWGEIIFIDSDLKSLDPKTRQKVFKYLSSLTNNHEKKYTFIIKDPNNQLGGFVDYHLNYKSGIWSETLNDRKHKQKQEPDINERTSEMVEAIQQIKAALQYQEISRMYQKQAINQDMGNEQQETPLPKFNEKSQSNIQQGMKMLLFYFRSSQHLLFMIFFVAMKIVGTYFNRYINVTKPEDLQSYMICIAQIGCVHLLTIVFRSYFFAQANLIEAERICKNCNKLTIFNHITFYSSQQHQNQNNHVEKSNNSPQRLICLTNSISGEFPFILNIFFENLGTVFSSLAMVLYEVPYMLIFIIIFYQVIGNLDREYRELNQRIKVIQKNQQIQLMKVTNYIEQGRHYIQIFNQQSVFYQKYVKQLKKTSEIINRMMCLGLWVKLNYRIIVITFLIISIILYWLINEGYPMFMHQIETGIPNVRNPYASSLKNHAALAVMIKHILTLTDYISHFSLSFAETGAKAVSIERVRKYAQNKEIVDNSNQRKKHCEIRRDMIRQSFVEGIRGYLKPQDLPKLVQIRKMKFKYQQNSSQYILDGLDLSLSIGDRILLRGKSGVGKTTLLKIIMGLYPEQYFCQSTQHLISFSSQHPLRLPAKVGVSVEQSVDPYGILNQVPRQVRNIVHNFMTPLIQKESKKQKLSYEQQVVINNIRAYLYGYKGAIIYDQPVTIINQRQTTFLAVTHHRQFEVKDQYIIKDGRLVKEK